MKRLMMTKNSVVKIQNLTVNHKPRPIKSNPVCVCVCVWGGGGGGGVWVCVCVYINVKPQNSEIGMYYGKFKTHFL